ncbi:OmpH family outer membrane protein [Desulfovermiculus halophilus]|uniref:OmpH family outer membrane protein n=1 Tax=Desulfovermiculus halophilus TaxID=339722 RepID=UPI0006863551|nr:OmpH family outer membrane protein [Desulfovermiculus halophilus]
MRNTMCGLLLVLCGLIFWPSLAPAQDVKLGVVDLQAVMEKSEPGQKAIQQLKSEFTDMKSELDKKKAAIDKLRQEMQNQSLVLSQEAQLDKETEYKQKVRDFQDLYQNYQRKMQLKEQQLREPIIKELVSIVRDYGEKNGYTLIMDKKNSGVVYNSDAIEITKPVIAELNKTWRNKK